MKPKSEETLIKHIEFLEEKLLKYKAALEYYKNKCDPKKCTLYEPIHCTDCILNRAKEALKEKK